MKKYFWLSLLITVISVAAIAVISDKKSAPQTVVKHETTTPPATNSDQLKQEQDDYKTDAVIKTKKRAPVFTESDKFIDAGDTQPFSDSKNHTKY